VEISCTYRYPSRINGGDTQVQETFWFTELGGKQPVDLRTDSDYQDRVEYSCSEKSCTLRITDLRESDSAEYKFRFITNQPGGRYTGSPGVTLKVTDLQVPSAEIVEGSSVTLTCSSDANPAANYTWYKEKQKLIQGPEGVYHFSSISSEDRGNYYFVSLYMFSPPDVPKLPSVSVSPSAEIVEGSSVTLTCSSDANPAANYTWYKENEDSPKASGQIFTITDFRAEHSGNYSCKAQNSRGRQNSTLQLLVVAGELLIPQHDPFLFSLVNPLRKPTPLSHVQLFLSNLQSRLDPIILVTSSVCSLSLFSSHTYTTHSFVFLYIEVFTGRPAQSWVCFYT
uniref:B-cell receptor CD22 n=1 Tax=Sparus aurata TaxID=8175 RepID=A0A671WXE1_SPAAU